MIVVNDHYEVMVKKLMEAFKCDATIKEACYYAGIAEMTYYNFIKKHPEYKEEFEACRHNPVMIARMEVVKGMIGNPELALKYLKLKRNAEFNERVDLQGDLNININLNDVQSDFIQKRLEAELVELEAKDEIKETLAVVDKLSNIPCIHNEKHLVVNPNSKLKVLRNKAGSQFDEQAIV